MVREPLELAVGAATVRHPIVARALSWMAILLLSPTVVFPLAWALCIWCVLRLERWYLDARTALRRAPVGSVRIDDRGLLLQLQPNDERVEIPRAQLKEGWLEPAEGNGATADLGEVPGLGRLAAAEHSAGATGGSVIALRATRGRLLYLRVSDDETGREVLDRMGVGPLQQVLRVPLGSRAAQAGEGTVFHLLGPLLLAFVSLGMALFAVGGILGGNPLGILAGLAALAAMGWGWMALLRYAAPGTAVVGADGVSVEYLGRRRRFLPHVRITDVREQGRVVTLCSGVERVVLPTATFVADAPEFTRTLAARIRHARAAALTRATADAATAKLQSLERDGRTVSAWRAQLSKVSADAGDYRRTGFEAHELCAVIEDPTAPAERRVGAALALGSRGTSADATRARVAAAACAYAPLRIAIEGALDGDLDDDELERATTVR